MMEGINIQNAELYFFSGDEVTKGMGHGPGIKLRDAIARPHKLADTLVVDLDVLSHMVLGRWLQTLPSSWGEESLPYSSK